MVQLIRLPTGSRIAPSAVRLLEARTLHKPMIGDDGAPYRAMVAIETRTQFVRIPCASYADAVALRDALAEEIDAIRAAFEARHKRTCPAAGSATAESPGTTQDQSEAATKEPAL